MECAVLGLMVVIGLCGLAILHLYGIVNEMGQKQDRDGRYFEWWMRSMENRKADKPEVESEWRTNREHSRASHAGHGCADAKSPRTI